MPNFNNKENKVKSNFQTISISLASPEDIIERSCGEVLKPETVNYRTYKPERDGLFCEKIFGPTKDYECYCGKYKRIRYRGIVCDRCGVEVTEKKVRRERMGHITLTVPVAHIWYFKSAPNKISAVLGLPSKKLESVIYYEKYIVTRQGASDVPKYELLAEDEYLDVLAKLPGNENLPDSDPDKFIAKMGAEGIYDLLKEIDPEQLCFELRQRMLVETSQQRKAEILKRLQVVKWFAESKRVNRPEWMIMKVIPVIPPDLRPLVPLDGGRFATSDLNDLYRRVIIRNNRLKKLIEIKAPEVILRNEKRMLQEAVDSLFDNSKKSSAVKSESNRALKSLSDSLKVATVTDTNRMVMKWRGKTIVDIDRSFIDTAGAPHEAEALLESPAEPKESPLVNPLESVAKVLGNNPDSAAVEKAWIANMQDLACCSQRGLGEGFDGSIGASSVLMPYGGKYQCTPEAGMAAKIPVLSPRETSTVSLMSYGFDPRVAQWSAWHGGQTAVLSSLAKITCLGGRASTCYLSFQEFFGRAVDKKTWGYPAAALLGALDAQNSMGTGSIGGKDSMSGTFEKLNVPHTLVSFAVTTDTAKNIRSGSFQKAGNGIYLVSVPYSQALAPDFETFKQNSEILYKLNASGKISAMYPVTAGGIAEAVSKMAMGNRIGAAIRMIPESATAAELGLEVSARDLFTPLYGSIIVESAEDLEALADFAEGTVVKLGETTAEKSINVFGTTIALDKIEKAWEEKLSVVFPPVSGKKEQDALEDWAKKEHESLAKARESFNIKNLPASKPRVIIPVFPGTNCEYDMARAFNLNGAETKIMVFRNRTPEELSQSLRDFAKEIQEAQILAFSGGFSSGDEPDGSGKYIANVIREHQVADAIMDLLKKRNGLVLGICNGFQALIKTGLVPYGEIRDMTDKTPTLTFNNVGRLVSRVVRTRIVSANSPWALDKSVLEPKMHLIPVSHGEGRIVMEKDLAKQLFQAGQVFTQYVDENGMPSISEPDNPNGSLFAIEGLTSPDGHVLGKMGHNERTVGLDANGSSADLIKNIAVEGIASKNENSCQNIFRAGVSYFA